MNDDVSKCWPALMNAAANRIYTHWLAYDHLILKQPNTFLNLCQSSHCKCRFIRRQCSQRLTAGFKILKVVFFLPLVLLFHFWSTVYYSSEWWLQWCNLFMNIVTAVLCQNHHSKTSSEIEQSSDTSYKWSIHQLPLIRVWVTGAAEKPRLLHTWQRSSLVQPRTTISGLKTLILIPTTSHKAGNSSDQLTIQLTAGDTDQTLTTISVWTEWPVRNPEDNERDAAECPLRVHISNYLDEKFESQLTVSSIGVMWENSVLKVKL